MKWIELIRVRSSEAALRAAMSALEALVEGIASNVHELLDADSPEQDPESADTAIFYSISNAQAGLRGISFGDFLIKRVVDSLRGELDNLKAFATLSPIPGFRRWFGGEDLTTQVAA